MIDSHFRSALKAISWRIFATMTTMIITYCITSKLSFAIYIGLFEFISKIALFYLHERVWGMTSFGLQKSRPKEMAGA